MIVILDMKVVKPASEVAGKFGSPEQLSDQLSVLENIAKEMKQSGNSFLQSSNRWLRSMSTISGSHFETTVET